MSDSEKIEKIGKISSVMGDDEKVDRYSKIVPNREYFEHLMEQKVSKEQAGEAIRVEEAHKPTPMEEAQRLSRRLESTTETPSMKQLLTQAENTVEKIDSVKRKLATPELGLPPSVQNVLRSKLTHIDESLKIALSKVGVDYVPPDKPKGLISPVQRFIGYLTHSQGQLESLGAEAQRLHDNRDQLSASSLLSIQLKVGLIQQQLEFFSNVLNKALESTKTIMNVQV